MQMAEMAPGPVGIAARVANKMGIDPVDIMGKVIKTAVFVLVIGAVLLLGWFFLKNPLRAGGPHNLARKESNATAVAFREMIARFWEFYGDELEEWWSGLIDKSAEDEKAASVLKQVCDEWSERGKGTVFNTVYMDANKEPNVRKGNIGFDLQAGFYAYPDRDLSGFANLPGDVKEKLRIDKGDGSWPRIQRRVVNPARDAADEAPEPVDPAADFDLWFDYEAFDPRQKVDHEDDMYDVEGFIRNMLAVQRHELLMCALPRFVETMHARHNLFRHIPIPEIAGTVEWIEEKGAGFEDPESLPDFLLRLGVKKADAGCIRISSLRLRAAAAAIDGLFTARIHAGVAGNTELAKSIARNADPSTLLDLEKVSACDLADRVAGIKAEKNSALYFANRSIRAWRGVRDSSERLAALMDSGYVNTLIVKEFVRTASATFENSMTDFLKCLRLADAEGNLDRNALSKEYMLWHGALDVLRAVEDDTLEDTLEQLSELSGDLESADNAILRACGDGVGKRVTATYHEYVNAINCAVYVQGKWETDRNGRRVYTTGGYLDDAKRKFNTRYTNPLSAENFYSTYFNDLFQAHWNKDTYNSGIPRADCKDCFKPHVSPLGTVYNIESLKEFTIRFWQSRGGIGKSLIGAYRKGVKKALRNTLLDCEFSAAFVRKMMGAEFDGKGYYGGTSNRVHVYTVSLQKRSTVWSITDGDWVTLDSEVPVYWVWEDVEHGSEIVFEDCEQGGTVIYSRYPDRQPMDRRVHHRYLTADRSGVLHTDNRFYMGAMNFSLCKAGGGRQQLKPSRGELGAMGDYTEVDGGGKRIPEDPEEREIWESARETNFETFAAEPSSSSGRSALDQRAADYCYASDADDAGGGEDQAGLFQVIDVEDPPDRMSIDASRRVLVLSRSKRHDGPHYANKRLMTLGFDADTETYRPTLINDTPENRGRAVLTLTMHSISTTGEAVLGFPTKDRGYYPYFLDKDAKRLSVKKGYDKKLWLLVLVVAAAALATPFTGGASVLAATAVTATVVGGVISAHQGYVGGTSESEQTRHMLNLMLGTGQIINNKISKNGKMRNPFTDKSVRYMLVMERPGLWPEFSLVPYVSPTRTVGSEEPASPADNPEAAIVPRDYKTGASRVVFIPAKNVKKNSVRLAYPPMTTEHGADNFTRKGMPFYVYAPHKRMFLVPDDPPYWVNADGDPERTTVQIRLKGTDMVLDVRGGSSRAGARVQLHPNRRTDNQKFKRLYEGATEATTAVEKLGMAFKLASQGSDDRCVAANKDEAGVVSLVQFSCLNGDAWRFVDGRLVTEDESGPKYAEARTTASGKPTGWLSWTRERKSSQAQQFVMDLIDECGAGSLVYGEKDVVEGRVPDMPCIKPWYVYELSPRDLTEDQRKRIDDEADRNA